MAIRVLINGSKGKMGSMAAYAIRKDPALELVATSDIEDNLKQVIINSKAEVVVDLTRASAVFANATAIIEAGARPVIGTSGLMEDQVKILQTACAGKKLGGIIAPNFSISVIMMQKFAKQAVRYLPHVEIIEMHHPGKEDSPSGTAIRTAELLAEANPELSSANSKELIKSARGASYKGINIHSVRLPGYNAHQEIILGNLGETLTIRSDVGNREAYMPGICLACREVIKLNSLIYGLEELF
jgi:4-hydroxy-tetrahydrodipicolinate reductase